MTRLAALLCAALVLLPLSAAATYVSANGVVVEGQPATLDLWNECPPILCAPTHPLIGSHDVVTWSFGDGSPDVAVTGSTTVTHTYSRGLYNVTATASG